MLEQGDVLSGLTRECGPIVHAPLLLGPARPVLSQTQGNVGGREKKHTALPKMAKAAQSGALRAAFKKHEVETEHQIARLGMIFGMLDKSAKEEPSLVVGALIDESMEVRVEFKDSSALDAGLIAGAQALEHYEIACYGTLKAWAEQLDIRRAVDLLEETLAEEKKTDEALTKLAEDMANPRAERENREPRRTGAGVHAG